MNDYEKEMLKSFIKEGKVPFEEAVKLLGVKKEDLDFTKEEIEEVNNKAKEYKKEEIKKDKNQEIKKEPKKQVKPKTNNFKESLKIKKSQSSNVKKVEKIVEVENKEFEKILMNMILNNLSLETAAINNDISEKELYNYFKSMGNSKNARTRTLFNFTNRHVKDYNNFMYFDSEQKQFIDEYLKSRIRSDKNKEQYNEER